MIIELDPTFLTVDEAKELKDTKAKIVSETTKEKATINEKEKEMHRCNLILAQDDKKVIWSPNQRSLANLIGKWKNQSKDWIGKTIELKIEKSSKGQSMIVAYPVD